MKMYFIALLPPAEIEAKINALKLEVKEQFGAKHTLKLPAHITLLAPFKMAEEMEVKLQQLLEEVARETTSFNIFIAGFGCFPPRVIFLKINNHQPVIDLHHRLYSALNKAISFPNFKEREVHPHISIASRDLTKEKFVPAWQEFRERQFTADFRTDYFCLFRHNGKSWELQDKFYLSNQC